MMDHLFKMIILLPCFTFQAGLKRPTNSKFFPIFFTILLGFLSPLCSF